LNRLSVIVVNWNGEHLLADCLGPLTGGPFDVIVVDNASTDGSVQLLEKSRGSVRMIVNQANRGFAVANNQGIATAKTDYVLLLNNDTVPNTAALEAVVSFLDEHPAVAIVGPTLVNPDASPQPSCGPGPNLWTELLGKTLLHRLLPGLRAKAPSQARAVDWVTGAALFARTSVLRELGGLDEGMFMFYEDLDLCARARERGHEVWFVPTAPIVHIGGASTRNVEAKSLVDSYRSTDRYFRQHGPSWRRWLVRAMTVVEMMVRSVIWTVLWLVPSKRTLARLRLRAYSTIARLAIGIGK